MSRAAVEVALSAQGFDPSRYAGRATTVVVPDATRPLDYATVLDPLLSRLASRGANVTVLVALGLHRLMTPGELAPLEAVAGVHGARVVQHDAADPAVLATISADVGLAPGAPLPARFHRAVVEAERVITVGIVEPHQYAGFSGGAKTIAIGCASGETIGAMHGLLLLRDPGTRIASIEGNPFQAALWRLVAGLSFEALLLVPSASGGLHDARFGPAREVFEQSVAVAERELILPVAAPYDWLHLPVPAVKAASFYQASRAATYVALVDRPAVRDGGVLIVEAACPEGAGAGAGERAFARAMERGASTLLAELRSGTDRPASGGEQRAYVLALALERHRIVLSGAPPIAGLRAIGIDQYASVAEASSRLGLAASGGRTIEDVFACLPRLQIA